MSEETKTPGPEALETPASSPATPATAQAPAGEKPAREADPAWKTSAPGRPGEPRPRPSRGGRPELAETREPLYREAGGFRLRLEPADLARLRELPGSKGKTERELGEEFFEKQASRFAEALAEDVTPPAEVRVVVDPYSRQAFLAVGRTIRGILSF